MCNLQKGVGACVCVCVIIVITLLLLVFVQCHLEAESVVLHELKSEKEGGVSPSRWGEKVIKETAATSQMKASSKQARPLLQQIKSKNTTVGTTTTTNLAQ